MISNKEYVITKEINSKFSFNTVLKEIQNRSKHEYALYIALLPKFKFAKTIIPSHIHIHYFDLLKTVDIKDMYKENLNIRIYRKNNRAYISGEKYYEIYTCSCSVMECAGIYDGIYISHPGDEKITWILNILEYDQIINIKKPSLKDCIKNLHSNQNGFLQINFNYHEYKTELDKLKYFIDNYNQKYFDKTTLLKIGITYHLKNFDINNIEDDAAIFLEVSMPLFENANIDPFDWKKRGLYKDIDDEINT